MGCGCNKSKSTTTANSTVKKVDTSAAQKKVAAKRAAEAQAAGKSKTYGDGFQLYGRVEIMVNPTYMIS